MMCWVALDRASKLAQIRGDQDAAATWRATANEIQTDVLTHGVSKRGVLRQHYETDALDASTLLPASLEFLAHDDERLRKTVFAVSEELTENGFVLRYCPDETDDGLSGNEGTFVICSFWLVSAFAIIGEIQRAGVSGADRLSPRPLCRRIRSEDREAPGELPASVLASRADRGDGPHDC
jgi:GH15 family glucan-1,4-alpha-glucosidase